MLIRRVHHSRAASFIRILWVGATFLLLFLPCLMGGIIGGVAGLIAGIRAPRRFFYEWRCGALNGAIRVAQVLLPLSSRAYESLFARDLYERMPLPRLTHEFLVVGHRGAPSECCENTLYSYEMALREGANALEIDLCLTQDGEVVLWHDWDPDSIVSLFREGGMEAFQRYRPDYGEPPFRRRVSTLTLDELRTHYKYVPRAGGTPDPAERLHIPTFREFLQWAVKQRKLHAVFLDIKIPPDEIDKVEPFMQVLQRDLSEICPGFESLAMTIYPEVYAKMKSFGPDLSYCFDVELTNAFMGNDDDTIAASGTIRHAERLGNRFCSVGRPTFLLLAPWDIYRGVVAQDLAYRHERKLKIQYITWTINEPMEQRWLTSAGVDGILTDLPGQLARQMLRRKTREMLRTPFKILRRKT